MNGATRRPDVIAAIRERSGERAFGREPLTDAELSSLVAAASLAPSAGNAQPWRFVLCRRGTPSFGTLVGTLREKNRWAADAPVVIATAVRTHHVHPTKPPKRNRLALFELGLATGNLIAQGTALGLIARPLGGFDRPAVRAALAVPEGWELGVLVAVGPPREEADPSSDALATIAATHERLGVREIVFEGTWGREPSGLSVAPDEPGPDEPSAGR